MNSGVATVCPDCLGAATRRRAATPGRRGRPARRVRGRPHLARAVVAARDAGASAFEVVGAYEWEDFGLDDTRSTWIVQAMASAADGDVMLDVVAPSGG